MSQDQFALAVRAGAHGSDYKISISRLRATVLGWEVTDIESMVAWLRGRGVILEDYPFIQDRKLGVWTAPGGARIAWFKDPDGNVLSVSQHT